MYNPKGAWIEYWHLKPGFDKPQRKVGFMMPASNTPYQVVSGVYNDLATVEELNKISNRYDSG